MRAPAGSCLVLDDATMSKRPDLFDMRADSQMSAASTGSKSLRSPRIHVAGEAPPELSPLDAFALQSRLLAKQLSESNRDGNRMSRLPPLTVESPLVVQGRSDYFRSMSAESPSDGEFSETSPGLGLKTEMEDAFPHDRRPRSMHPRVSRIPPTPDVDIPSLPDFLAKERRHKQVSPARRNADVLAVRREMSSSPIQSDTQSIGEKEVEASPVKESAARTASPFQAPVLTGSPERTKHGAFNELGLVPPPSLFPKRSSSALSSSVTEEDELLSKPGSSTHSTGAAPANPAFSPALSSPFKRSPSVASDSSSLPRPSFNFSRPLSRSSTPGFDLPARQASSDSHPSFVLADDAAQTPISMHSEAFVDQQLDDGRNGAPSYIYSKYSLPRGKSIQRSEPNDKDSQPSSQWGQLVASSGNAQRHPTGAPPSPPTRPSSSSARIASDDGLGGGSGVTRPSLDTPKMSSDSSRLGASGFSLTPGRPSEEVLRGRTLTSTLHEPLRGRTPASTTTSDSASTVRPPAPSRSHTPTVSEMSAEEHLAKGIECHEQGALNKSTYHLRLAARQNNPTAMLLYALACRHGWGMRANQREGVEWLRKAAEFASVEIADDEDQVKEGRALPANIIERRARKAQFALSIYELGVSHMNGWGIEQDKSLALRCFEIAGSKWHRSACIAA